MADKANNDYVDEKLQQLIDFATKAREMGLYNAQATVSADELFKMQQLLMNHNAGKEEAAKSGSV